MPKREHISMSVVRRLPRYYRFLSELRTQGVMRISSKELATKMNLTASQVRQDFNCFGGFGQQGYGYSVEQLHDEIENILGLRSAYKAILIGAGNLGRAVAMHMSFETRGFQLIGIFDRDEELIGTEIRNTKVYDIRGLADFCKINRPSVAMLCIPKSSVGPIAQTLYDCGIKNYWNFSHYDLSLVYDDVIMENVHMSDSLMILCYRITQSDNCK
ncbi:MAG TPA: redox-sensing transcriptional repressor Rex [Candidatus Scatavimonas merdigallinarum]|uniref:Redox-sensing transcriptional repressor Rex n=1 Tax=Candidatus Scatavimonas merdigallinarum TaxID=2840914 RepID=A0A9D0ZGA5_9FIRM|nr:redox-sensing transcriptional repressor Rex [Candidatus Scatavimonas merdigallinarum]